MIKTGTYQAVTHLYSVSQGTKQTGKGNKFVPEGTDRGQKENIGKA